MSPTNVTPRDGIGRPRTPVERRPFGPTIAEPAVALRMSAGRGPIDPPVLRPAAPEAVAEPEGGEPEGGTE